MTVQVRISTHSAASPQRGRLRATRGARPAAPSHVLWATPGCGRAVSARGDEAFGGGRTRVASFLENLRTLRYSRLSHRTAEKARLCLLDALGNMVAASRLPEALAVHRAEGALPRGRATILGWHETTSALRAAFHNGVHADLLEAQDGHRRAGLHPGEATIPAELAVAELHDTTFGELLSAMVAGYEVAVRFGEVLFPEQTRSGFYPDGTTGPLGGALAASQLLGLTAETAERAVSAAAFAAPISLVQSMRREAKPLVAGLSAALGLRAALWAREGLGSGPETFAPPNGFFQQLTPTPHFARLVARPAGSWAVDEVYIKPYPGGRHSHAPLDAVREILAGRSTDPRTVRAVDVRTYRAALMLTGSMPGKESPLAELTQSIRYVIAVGIADGLPGPERFDPRRRHEPAVLSLSRRIRLAEDPIATRAYPRTTRATVTLTLRNGHRATATVDHRWGDPERPMSVDEVRAKFLRSLHGRPGGERAWATVWGASRDSSVRDLIGRFSREIDEARR